MRLENEGGLFTYEDNGVNRCLGYLLVAEGHGVYDAEAGKVEVSPEDAQKHNQVFDEMMVKGLDENCQVGQGNNFYVSGNTVKTWLGTVLGEATKVRSTYTFTRKGMKFTGTLPKGEEMTFFERVE
jgi:hypothetical protein